MLKLKKAWGGATHVYIQQVAWIRCEYGPCRQAEMGVMQTWDQFRLSLKKFHEGKTGDCWHLLASLFSVGSFWNHRLVALSFVPVFTSAATCNEGFEISLHGGERRVCENSSDQPWYASCVVYRSMVSTYRVFPSVFLWRYMTIPELANWQHGRNTNKIESIANMNAQQWSIMHISSHGCLRDQRMQVDRLDPNCLCLFFGAGDKQQGTNAVPLPVPGLSGWHGERGKDRCTSCRTGTWAHLSRSPRNPISERPRLPRFTIRRCRYSLLQSFAQQPCRKSWMSEAQTWSTLFALIVGASARMSRNVFTT